MRKVRKIRRIIRRVVLLIIVIGVIVAAVRACSADGDTSNALSLSGGTEVFNNVDNDVSSASAVFSENENTKRVTFVKKIDGDTAWFNLDGEDIKVRFLGIDTPETVKQGVEVQDWGPEASDYTYNRLANASEIYLEWDDNSDKQDAYDRYLAWIWVDGSLLEEELLSLGYAEVKYIYGDYKYLDTLYAAQDKAQADGVGLWSD